MALSNSVMQSASQEMQGCFSVQRCCGDVRICFLGKVGLGLELFISEVLTYHLFETLPT